jgi:hypothetical protein
MSERRSEGRRKALRRIEARKTRTMLRKESAKGIESRVS